VTAAAAILQTMDQSVKPCDDFYQYACGGWIKNTIVPEGKSLWGTFGIIEQQNQRIIKIILGQCKPSPAQSALRSCFFYFRNYGRLFCTGKLEFNSVRAK
jgi:neprilysin